MTNIKSYKRKNQLISNLDVSMTLSIPIVNAIVLPDDDDDDDVYSSTTWKGVS
jgi:hypothetical protein